MEKWIEEEHAKIVCGMARGQSDHEWSVTRRPTGRALAAGTRWDEDLGCARVDWMLFPAGTSDEQVAEQFRLGGSEGSGPGTWFSRDADIRRTSTRVLVKKWSAMDI